MATRAMLGLGENFSYFRIHAADLNHDYLHDRESHIEEIVAIFPAKLMTESINYYFMGSLGILIFTSLFVSLPFVLVVKRQVILPLNRLIGDMSGVSANLLTPREKKSLADDGSIIAEARLALSKLQHEVEREMIQREKLAAVGREIGKINHDMRNALSSFMLLSDNLTNSKDEQVREIAPLMIVSIERAVMFCNRTMEFVKPQGSFEPSMVTMDSVMEEVSGSSGIAVEYNGPSKMCLDEHQFYRLLKNLVVNAADASADRISVNSGRQANMLCLTLPITGPVFPLK
jgi:signal transduction histidine kinase